MESLGIIIVLLLIDATLSNISKHLGDIADELSELRKRK